MQPINYMQDVQSPFQAAAEGMKFGLGWQELDAANQQRKLQQQQMIQAQEQQKMIAERMNALLANKNAKPEDYANLSMLLPKDQAESVRKAGEMMSSSQASSKLNRAGQVMAALNSGAADVALNLMQQEADAYRNAGDEENAKATETYAQIAKVNPDMARMNIGILISQLPGGDKVIESVNKMQEERRKAEKAPAELTEAQAKAQSAAVAAKFAESNAAADLEKKGWDIRKVQSDMDIAKQNAKIAMMNAGIAREGNMLKRQELQLKVAEAVQKRDDLVKSKTSEVENARFNIDNLLNTADRILATPMDVIGSAAGPISSRMMTTKQSTADFESLIENLDAQAFLSQIPQMKGTGALSDAEGKKLAAALQNFSLKQSPERLVSNVKEAQRLMLKARKNLSERYGIPDTVPDTPAAKPGAIDIDALVKKYGGG